MQFFFQFKELGVLENLAIDQPILLSEDFSPVKGSFSFAPPQDISIIGSFATNLGTSHSPTFDLALILPKVRIKIYSFIYCN